MVWHLHTSWNDHHDKSTNPLSPYKVITISLTIFLMLYITSPWLIYFITGGLYLLIPLTYFVSLTPLPSGNHPFFSVFMSLFSFCFVCLFCFLDSTYKWDHRVFIFVRLISISIIPSRSIHVVTNGKILFFMAE